MAPNSGEKKRRGLRGLFSSDPEPEPSSSSAPKTQQRPAVPDKDSGYGSASSKNTELTPIENHGQVQGVDAERNLAVNTRTGQVVDDDTGEVVSTVTTTTTTTTTTIRRSKSPAPQSVNGGGGDTLGTTTSHTQQHLSPESAAHPPPSQQRPPELQHLGGAPELPPRSKSRSNTGASAPPPDNNLANGSGGPPIPVPPRQSPRFPPRSPGPSSGAPQSTRQNLKDAAHGLNEVRKTISNEVEQRRSQRIRAADLKNQAAPQPPPASQHPAFRQTPSNPNFQQPSNTQQWAEQQFSPNNANSGQSNWQAPPAWSEQPQPSQSPAPRYPGHQPYQPPPPPVPDQPEDERLRKRKSLSSMPASFSPESNGQVEEQSGGMFKRLRGKRSPMPP